MLCSKSKLSVPNQVAVTLKSGGKYMKIHFSIFLHFPLAHFLGVRQTSLQWTEVNEISNTEECNLYITKLLRVPYIFDEHTLVMSDTIIFNNK